MPNDPCMFCGEYPCECTGKKKQSSSGLARKSLPKKEPDSKPEPRVERPPKRQVKSPAPSLQRERTIDPELEQVIRTLDYFDMLHPDEQKKYEQFLAVPKTTGKLIELDRDSRGGETASGNEHETGGGEEE